MIRIVIIDDSDMITKLIKENLLVDDEIQIVGSTSDISKGRDLILTQKPDAMVFSIENTHMKAIAFLRNLLSEIQLPVIVLSSFTQKGKLLTLQALESGAIDFIFTPFSDIQRNISEIITLLRSKLEILKKAKIPVWKSRAINVNQGNKNNLNSLGMTKKVIAIGASIGGTEAISNIITRLPATMPGIVVVLPLPSGFTKTYANRLNELSKMQVKEAENGDKIINGSVLIAPGDFHIKIIRSSGRYKVLIENGEKINDHRPSINILMTSLAGQASADALGIILTGEGSDGALGMKSIKENGGITIVQDEKTSIIYDMPKATLELKVVDYQLAIEKIADKLIELVSKETQ